MAGIEIYSINWILTSVNLRTLSVSRQKLTLRRICRLRLCVYISLTSKVRITFNLLRYFIGDILWIPIWMFFQLNLLHNLSSLAEWSMHLPWWKEINLIWCLILKLCVPVKIIIVVVCISVADWFAAATHLLKATSMLIKITCASLLIKVTWRIWSTFEWS